MDLSYNRVKGDLEKKGGHMMKLTGELKENVEKAVDKEQAKEIIEQAGMVLTDEEMDQVNGGSQIKRRVTFK